MNTSEPGWSISSAGQGGARGHRTRSGNEDGRAVHSIAPESAVAGGGLPQTCMSHGHLLLGISFSIGN
jgi:hypothetical protein